MCLYIDVELLQINMRSSRSWLCQGTVYTIVPKMVASTTTAMEASNSEAVFYEEVEKYINSLNEKFQQKIDCRRKCFTKQCPCKKANVSCLTKCHSKLGPCKTMGY